MEIRLEDLWQELALDTSLSEYVETQIDATLARLTTRVDKFIEAKVDAVVKEVLHELGTTKCLINCADKKINKHLILHQKMD